MAKVSVFSWCGCGCLEGASKRKRRNKAALKIEQELILMEMRYFVPRYKKVLTVRVISPDKVRRLTDSTRLSDEDSPQLPSRNRRSSVIVESQSVQLVTPRRRNSLKIEAVPAVFWQDSDSD